MSLPRDIFNFVLVLNNSPLRGHLLARIILILIIINY
nr:MAG TPA: hypothetical protein [Caudoviricetes sp.]